MTVMGRSELLSVREIAAEVLGCSEDHVWRLIYGGQLQALRIGRIVRVHRDDLESLISKSRQPSQNS